MTEDLICPQEENPVTQILTTEIEKYIGISCFSVRRMVKRKRSKQFKV